MKEKILNTALKIVLEVGINGLSMRNIANDLKVTATALYRHFKNKDEIILNLINNGYYDLLKQLTKALSAENAKLRLLSTFNLYLKFALENTTLFNLMNGTSLKEFSSLPSKIIKINASSEKFLTDRILEFAIEQNKNLNIEQLKDEFLYLLNGFIVLKNLKNYKKSDEELLVQFKKILTKLLND